MKRFKTISGVLCRLESDENDFVDVYIKDGQKLLPEWLVCGAVDLTSAYFKARLRVKE